MFLLSLFAFAAYYLILTELLGLKLPMRIKLEERSAMLDIRQEDLEDKMAHIYSVLEELHERDNGIYRPSFGKEGRAFPTFLGGDMDLLYNIVYEQSLSYDSLEPIAESSGKMSSCVPSIPPLFLERIHMTSRFGVRSDPMNGEAKVHQGVDLAGKEGEHIFATGDGRIEKVEIKFTGYGNEIVIDHGFGYKTRYAHLKEVLVHVGDRVPRGDMIALMGSTGKSTGPHLHYEVEYMGRRVNPLNFFDTDITTEEYSRLVKEGKR